jgi:P-type Cu+ transporter
LLYHRPYLCWMEKSVERKVGGMTCGNCALTITTYLKKQGATDAVANAATGDLSFTVTDESNIDTMLEGIKSLGYTIDEQTEGSELTQGASLEKKLFLISLILWIPLIAHMFLNWTILHHPWFQLALSTPIYLIGLFYFGSSALRSLRNGIPNMDVLIFLGSSAAYFYSLAGWYLYPEQVHSYLFFETAGSIITLVLFGNFLEEYTVQSTAGAIKALMSLQKTKAKLILTDSIGKETIQEVDHTDIRLHDLVLVNTGDQVPVDGEITSGEANIDESMISGESIPVAKSTGSKVVGGSLVTNGSIRVKTTAVGSDTTLSHIIKLVNQAQAAKPPMQKLADRISAIFVPVVIGIAALTFFINFFIVDLGAKESMMRTIAVMVIACPCAMGLATPAAVMVGLGRAARNGILIKGGDSLEAFKDIRQFVFDKTGTLTTGKLTIDTFETDLDKEVFKQIVVSVEQHSSHPIAKSICENWQADTIPLTDILEEKGIGIRAKDAQQNLWQIGSFRIDQSGKLRHDILVRKNGQQVGWIDLKDELRPDAITVIQTLQRQGYKTIMLSGDRDEKCQRIARELGITEVYSEQLPAQKMTKLEQLMHSVPSAMVGDGINDAPALAKATIGISLSEASEIAKQSAHVLLLHNKLGSLPLAIGLGKHTYLTIKQNLFWAFAYNIIAIPVAAAGFLTPTWGAGVMALSDVVLIINSLRLRFKKV